MKKLKIAIYSICKNELQFVDKWMNSMLEADYVVVLDTGSTDGTYERLLEWQEQFPDKVIIHQKTYNPWRFDTPRNDCMQFIPKDADILFSTDLDEVLLKEWSQEVRLNWTKNTTKGVYLFAWNHLENGDPGKLYWYDKIHNWDYVWKFPVHESLHYIQKDKNKEVITQISSRVLLHHYPDQTKSRASYLNLTKLRVKENPDDVYSKIYHLHELFVSGEYKQCIDYGSTIIDCVWKDPSIETDLLFAPDICRHVGDSYAQLNNLVVAEYWYKMGISIFPKFRECYIGLIYILLLQERFTDAKEYVEKMFQVTERFYSWLEREVSWDFLPYQLAALTYLENGNLQLAKDYALLAKTLAPNNKQVEEDYNMCLNIYEGGNRLKKDMMRQGVEYTIKKEEVN